MKRLLGKIFMGKKRKELLEDFAGLLLEIPKANSNDEVLEGYQKVGEFVKRLDYKNKKDAFLKEACGKLIEYLSDTKEHMDKGFHKPAHNGWKTVTVYPDINDYIKLGEGVRLRTF